MPSRSIRKSLIIFHFFSLICRKPALKKLNLKTTAMEKMKKWKLLKKKFNIIIKISSCKLSNNMWSSRSHKNIDFQSEYLIVHKLRIDTKYRIFNKNNLLNKYLLTFVKLVHKIKNRIYNFISKSLILFMMYGYTETTPLSMIYFLRL